MSASGWEGPRPTPPHGRGVARCRSPRRSGAEPTVELEVLPAPGLSGRTNGESGRDAGLDGAQSVRSGSQGERPLWARCRGSSRCGATSGTSTARTCPGRPGIHRRPPPRPWAGGSTGSATSGGDGDPMAPAPPLVREGARPPRPPAEPATFDPTPLRQRGAGGGRYAGRAARARRDSGNRARRDPGVAVGLRSRPADRVRRPSR